MAQEAAFLQHGFNSQAFQCEFIENPYFGALQMVGGCECLEVQDKYSPKCEHRR